LIFFGEKAGVAEDEFDKSSSAVLERRKILLGDDSFNIAEPASEPAIAS